MLLSTNSPPSGALSMMPPSGSHGYVPMQADATTLQDWLNTGWDASVAMLNVSPVDHPITFAPFAYTPSIITITEGDSVTWSGSFSFHPLRQVTNATGDTPVAGGFLVNSGTSFSQTFASPGVIYFQCTNHGTFGGSMRGAIHVVARVSLTPRAYLPAVIN